MYNTQFFSIISNKLKHVAYVLEIHIGIPMDDLGVENMYLVINLLLIPRTLPSEQKDHHKLMK